MAKKKAEAPAEPQAVETSPALVSVARRLPSKLQRGRDTLVGYFRTIFYVHDLTDPQWRVLRTLSSAEEIDASETAKRAFLLPSSLSRILRDLGARGLLQSRVSDKDARRVMLSTMAVGGLVVLVLKRSVARARPELFFEKGIYGLGESFSRVQLYNSFPSSHTYAAFAVAVTLGILAPRWRWVFLLLAVLVAMSRLVNLDHYLSDVMTAAGIAVLVGHVLAPRVLGAGYQWPLRAPWRWWKK